MYLINHPMPSVRASCMDRYACGAEYQGRVGLRLGSERIRAENDITTRSGSKNLVNWIEK